MLSENRVRILIGSADPVRMAAAPPPTRSAADLIAHADALSQARAHALAHLPAKEGIRARRPRRQARPGRRLVLAGAALAVTAVVAAVTAQQIGTHRRPSAVDSTWGDGVVVVPIAYQNADPPPPAAGQLRALAARLTDAPYDAQTGPFRYHQIRDWGDPLMASPEGFAMSFVVDRETWEFTDNSSWSRLTQLAPQFPDHASQDYWIHHGGPWSAKPPVDTTFPPIGEAALPTDRAGLVTFMNVRYGVGAALKQVDTIYRRYVPTKATRAMVLDILADLPGLSWRGGVTDRSGRAGLAVTYDDVAHDEQWLLVFDPHTGVLLAKELVLLTSDRVNVYSLFLATGQTTQPGFPAPEAAAVPSPTPASDPTPGPDPTT